MVKRTYFKESLFIRRRVFNSMVYGSANPCFALSDKKIKLHILSDPKNKIGISEYFIPTDRGNQGFTYNVRDRSRAP